MGKALSAPLDRANVRQREQGRNPVSKGVLAQWDQQAR